MRIRGGGRVIEDYDIRFTPNPSMPARPGLIRALWHGGWSAHVYDGCGCSSVVHLTSIAEGHAEMLHGNIGEGEFRDAREFFEQGAQRVIVGPVDA